jgi:hypothetical protein
LEKKKKQIFELNVVMIHTVEFEASVGENAPKSLHYPRAKGCRYSSLEYIHFAELLDIILHI